MINPADRINTVEEYYFSRKLREIAKLINEGLPIINLGIGSPDLKPDKDVIKELKKISDLDNTHGYQSYKGLPQLRTAFSNWYKQHYHVAVDAEKEVLPLMGSKEGIMHISMTYLQPGDAVLVPDPGYPAYAAAAKLAGAEVITYDLTEANNYQPDFSILKTQDLSRVKIMWVNYPHMPTGTAAEKNTLRKLTEFAKEENILVVNDNPYSFILNESPQSIFQAGISEHLLELNSLSKSHNMAGWRIGVLIGSENHINNILKFKSNMDSGMFLPVQMAAAKALALNDNWYKSLNKTYRSRQKLGFEILETLGCSFKKTQTGMFVWGKAPENINDIDEWINKILYQKHVFITPGFIFGENGERFIRISLCSPKEKLNEALTRLNK